MEPVTSFAFNGAILSLLSVLANFSSPELLQVPPKLRTQLKSFEPSGALYLEDLDRYLLISDDTTEDNKPWVFLADSRGKIAPEPLEIHGLSQVMDLESLSQGDEGDLYFLSSQSLNRNGKDKRPRNLFVQSVRRGLQIEILRALELRPLLLEATGLSGDELDVESHFVWRGELYLGLKNPQPSGRGLILKLGSVERLLRERTLSPEDVSVAVALDFKGISGEDDLISDILRHDSQLIISTVVEDPRSKGLGGTGRIWTYDLERGKLQMRHTFPGFKPEGVALNSRVGHLWLVFDQGFDSGQFTTGTL